MLICRFVDHFLWLQPKRSIQTQPYLLFLRYAAYPPEHALYTIHSRCLFELASVKVRYMTAEETIDEVFQRAIVLKAASRRCSGLDSSKR